MGIYIKSICEDCKADVPCEACVSFKYYSEWYGWDVCPNVSGGPSGPCFPSETTPSCVGLNVSGTLYSDEFSESCASSGDPKVDVYATFDDLGTITGDGGFLTCNLTDLCESCGVQGTLTPFVETTSGGKIKLSVQYSATNAYWGGPYGLTSLYCTFYFE
jgi:hypothetical protein